MNSAKNMFEAMVRHGIGLDPYFFERTADAPNFPPHNIEQLDDDHYKLTLAVAGFSEAEIEIVLQHDILTVSGRKRPAEPQETHQMLYNGIAFRDFSRQFKVGEHVVVDGDQCHLQDGLLQIYLVRRLPETLKPKLIAINPAAARLNA